MSIVTCLLVLFQACLIQNVFAYCGTGPTSPYSMAAGFGPYATGFEGPYGIAGPMAAPFAGPYAAGFGEPYGYAGYPGYGLAPCSTYGGAGIGNVAVAGELPVGGATVVAGQIPIIGTVEYAGPVAAAGAVTITGSCTCGCGPYMY